MKRLLDRFKRYRIEWADWSRRYRAWLCKPTATPFGKSPFGYRYPKPEIMPSNYALSDAQKGIILYVGGHTNSVGNRTNVKALYRHCLESLGIPLRGPVHIRDRKPLEAFGFLVYEHEHVWLTDKGRELYCDLLRESSSTPAK